MRQPGRSFSRFSVGRGPAYDQCDSLQPPLNAAAVLAHQAPGINASGAKQPFAPFHIACNGNAHSSARSFFFETLLHVCAFLQKKGPHRVIRPSPKNRARNGYVIPGKQGGLGRCGHPVHNIHGKKAVFPFTLRGKTLGGSGENDGGMAAVQELVVYLGGDGACRN